MFDRQSMIVMPSPRANTIKKITCSLYHGGLSHGTNIRIYHILVFRIYSILTPLEFQILFSSPHTVYIKTQPNPFLCKELFFTNSSQFKFWHRDAINVLF